MPQFLKKYGKTLLITVCIIAGLTAAFFLTGKSKESVVQDAASSSVSVIVSQDADSKQRELSESENSALKKEQPLRSDDRTKRGSDADESVFAVSEPKEKSSDSQEQKTSESSVFREVSEKADDGSESSVVSVSADSDSGNSEDSQYLSVSETPESSIVFAVSEQDFFESQTSAETSVNYLSDTETDSQIQASSPDAPQQCTIGISCETLLRKTELLPKNKRSLVPPDGILLSPVTVTFQEGESVFDVTKRVCTERRIPFEFTMTPIYHTAYIEGICNLYEFDCGSGSGWVYSVNRELPNVGCSDTLLHDGDEILWHYTCELGNDISFPDP